MTFSHNQGLFVIAVCFGVAAPLKAALACEGTHRLVKELSVDLNRDQPTFRVLDKLYERFARGDAFGVLALLDKDVEWRVEGVEGVVPFAGTYNGWAGVLRYLRDLSSSVRIDELSMRFHVAQGNTIHVHLFESGIAKPTGKAFTMEIVHTWFFDGKRIVKFREFNDTFAMASAFDPTADPKYALVANSADDHIVPSDYPDALSVAMTMYAAIHNVDLSTFLAQLADNVVWILAGPTDITPIAGTYLGVSGVTDFLTRLFTTEQYINLGTNYMITEGSRMDAQFYEVIYVIKTQKVFSCEGIHTINVNADGKVDAFRSYNDTHSVAWGHTP